MKGLGTIINCGGIILGGILGIIFKKYIKEGVKKTFISLLGVIVIVIGLAGAIEKTIELINDNPLFSGGTLFMIVSLLLGTVIGELINIEGGLARFGEYLKKKSHSENDNSFLNAFLTSTFTVSIGAMAVIGSIQDGIDGDFTLLLVKSILDFVFIMVMSATLGKGCIFSSIPVAILQGSITIASIFIGEVLPILSTQYLSLVGNVLILCVGLNLLFDKGIKISNMLPSLIFAVAFGFIPV